MPFSYWIRLLTRLFERQRVAVAPEVLGGIIRGDNLEPELDVADGTVGDPPVAQRVLQHRFQVHRAAGGIARAHE